MSNEINQTLERMAEMLVLAEPSDMPLLADLHTSFQQVGKWGTENGMARVFDASMAAAALIEKVILEEAPNPTASLQTIGQVLVAFQAIMRDGRDAASVEWPKDLFPNAQPSVASQGGAPSGEGLYHPGRLPSHVDEAIFSEFLARQGGNMDEMEGYILALEKGVDENTMGALRRLIHTLKGEAALLGLEDVERLCHTAEDALGQRPIDELTDNLLSMKDWLSRAFDSYAGKGPAPNSVKSLLTLLQSGPAERPEPAPEAVPKAKQLAPAPVAEARPLDGDPDLLREFVAEAGEHLEASDVHLLTLETEPKNEDALNAVFRAFHTIKGVAGFMALDEIQSLSHEAENLLDKARKNELDLVDAAIDVTFDAVDMLKKLVANVREALTTGGLLAIEPSLPALVKEIRDVASGRVDVSQKPYELPPSEPGQKLGEILVQSGEIAPEAVARAVERQQAEATQKKIGEVLVETGKASASSVDTALEVQQEAPECGKVGEILVEMGAVSERDMEEALRVQQTTRVAPRVGEVLVRSGDASAKDVAQALRSQRMQQQPTVQVPEAVKVDAIRLDLLVDTIGELVIAESMVSQAMQKSAATSTEMTRHLGQLDKITRELQEMGTSLRMVPIRSTFQKMARLVRDLAKKSGKQVEFLSVGEDTELDKTVVDKIGDPLVHMVRNAVDHGLEASSEDRVRAGKPPVGRVELRAFHKGGSIYVEIEDDGRGLDREAILAKAVERNLIREGESLSDRDIFSLIFLPGFSTAKKITDVSGRGVGMDVVKRNIEALRGQVDIQSEKGRGSVFSIRLPLTLAIIDGMVVRVGSERYIIPTLSIVMSLRPEERQISTVVGRGEMMSLQGHLLPLFRTAHVFGIADGGQDISEGIVVVVENEGRRTGLLVDEILGQQQIVIKSLGESMQGIPGIAGGAIMPDGNVGLILDVGGLVRLANDVR